MTKETLNAPFVKLAGGLARKRAACPPPNNPPVEKPPVPPNPPQTRKPKAAGSDAAPPPARLKINTRAIDISTLSPGLQQAIAAEVQVQSSEKAANETGVVPRGKKQPQAGVMNGYEEAFRDHFLLTAEKAGTIAWWRFEAVKVKLAHNSWVSVDFLVMAASGVLFWIDAKACKEDGGFILKEDAGQKYNQLAQTTPFPVMLAGGYKGTKKSGGAWTWRGKWHTPLAPAYRDEFTGLMPGLTDEAAWGTVKIYPAADDEGAGNAGESETSLE